MVASAGLFIGKNKLAVCSRGVNASIPKARNSSFTQ